jgi:hypothetical protein
MQVNEGETLGAGFLVDADAMAALPLLDRAIRPWLNIRVTRGNYIDAG